MTDVLFLFARRFGVLCLIAIAAGHCGCAPNSGKSWETGAGAVTLSQNGTMISYSLERLACDEQVCFVVVANAGAGGTFNGGEGAYQGQLLVEPRVDWSCTTQDGRTGKVTVDGQEFDLSGGALFLVSAKDKPRRVEQLKIDPEKLEICSDARKFAELGETDPRIASFLQSCEINRPAPEQ